MTLRSEEVFGPYGDGEGDVREFDAADNHWIGACNKTRMSFRTIGWYWRIQKRTSDACSTDGAFKTFKCRFQIVPETKEGRGKRAGFGKRGDSWRRSATETVGIK